MKYCPGCKTTKGVNEFSKRSKARDGLQSRCKSCVKTYYDETSEIQKVNAEAWRLANPERRKQTNQAYRESERGKAIRKSHRVARKAVERGAGHMPNAGQTLAILIGKYGNKCLVPGCNNVDVTVDHVVPLSWGGPHSLGNLQLLCNAHNLIKGNRNANDYRPKVVV